MVVVLGGNLDACLGHLVWSVARAFLMVIFVLAFGFNFRVLAMVLLVLAFLSCMQVWRPPGRVASLPRDGMGRRCRAVASCGRSSRGTACAGDSPACGP